MLSWGLSTRDAGVLDPSNTAKTIFLPVICRSGGEGWVVRLEGSIEYGLFTLSRICVESVANGVECLVCGMREWVGMERTNYLRYPTS
jgi:hypothetical protein